MDGDLRQGMRMAFGLPLLSPSILLSLSLYLTLSVPLSYSLCPSILLSLPVYPPISDLLSLISGDRDGDRRQGMSMAFGLPLLSTSILLSLSLYLTLSAPLSYSLCPSVADTWRWGW
jgi:hypothetical protein